MRSPGRSGLAAAGVASILLLAAGRLLPASVPASSQTLSAGPPVVYVAFFDTPGCKGCEAGEHALKDALAGLSDARLVHLDPNHGQNFELFEVLAERAGLDPSRLSAAPSIFVDRDYLDLRVHGAADVRRIIAKHRATGTPRFWEVSRQDLAHARTAHIQRFQRFGVAAIAFAGLLDGVNPCAFATVMFLLSYLAWLGRTRRDILLAGLFFALGIFVPYYLIGAGLLHFSRELALLPVLKRWLFEMVAASALVFGLLSLRDAYRARCGRASEMTLKLPRFVQTRIHDAVKRTAGVGLVSGAFLAGAACALLEAVCTGQLYLPTLVYVAGVASLQSRALLYLLLYNGAFLVPLIVVVMVVYGGLSSKAIGKFTEAHTAVVKVALAVIFLVLAGLLHFSA